MKIGPSKTIPAKDDASPEEMPELKLDNMEDLEAIESLKKKMFKYARNLQFERAAELRDQIIRLRKKWKKKS